MPTLRSTAKSRSYSRNISASAATFSCSEISPFPATLWEETKPAATGAAFKGWHIPAAARASCSPALGSGSSDHLLQARAGEASQLLGTESSSQPVNSCVLKEGLRTTEEFGR